VSWPRGHDKLWNKDRYPKLILKLTVLFLFFLDERPGCKLKPILIDEVSWVNEKHLKRKQREDYFAQFNFYKRLSLEEVNLHV